MKSEETGSRPDSNSQDETGYGLADLARKAAFPNGRTMEVSDSSGYIRLICVSDSGNCKRGIEVLSNLGDYPISNGPSVNPIDVSGRVGSFDDDSRSESSD